MRSVSGGDINVACMAFPQPPQLHLFDHKQPAGASTKITSTKITRANASKMFHGCVEALDNRQRLWIKRNQVRMGLRVGSSVGLSVSTLHRPLSPVLNLKLTWLRLNHPLRRAFVFSSRYIAGNLDAFALQISHPRLRTRIGLTYGTLCSVGSRGRSPPSGQVMHRMIQHGGRASSRAVALQAITNNHRTRFRNLGSHHKYHFMLLTT